MNCCIFSLRLTMSIWQHKPWWCQPWSILFTGVSLITGSWFLVHRLWFSGLVAVPILTWMGFFLLLYPRVMQADSNPGPDIEQG
ncbi:MAG: hypothetical protein HC921_03260 [Synechococcaceae cyanobacterium SM2_3_1]|nr:hypothetical protein [Synechococcaceae cyanobacterium SM2_3_1]